MNRPSGALLIVLVAVACHHRDPDVATAPTTAAAAAAPAAPAADRNPSVQQLVQSDAWNGREVFVAGRCLGYSSGRGAGPPPATRSDWLLESDSTVIYVTGPLPTGCTATGGSADSTTIHARVEQDTLPTLGNMPARPRRYLVALSP